MALSLKAPKNGHRYLVLSYQRVSRDSGETGSHTFETQSRRIRECLETLCGSTPFDVVEFDDDGLSGGYGPEPTPLERRTRPGLKELVAQLRTRKYDLFMVYDQSRLVRNERWFHALIDDEILGTDTEWVSVTQPFNPRDPNDRAMMGMQAIFDSRYRQEVRKRNRDAALSRAQAGYYLGQTGYGWEWEPLADVAPHGRRRILPVAEERRWMEHIKDRYLAGWSSTKIVAELNELGVASPSGKAKWLATILLKSLFNPLHTGQVPSCNGLLPGEHWERRFWDPEVRDQLLAACAERKRWKKTNTARAPEHLLAGLVHCYRCGKRLYVGGLKRKRQFYQCHTGRGSGKVTCPGVLIATDLLEPVVVGEIERLAREPRVQELLREEAARAAGEQDDQLREEAAQLRRRVEDLQEQRDRLMEALARGVVEDCRFKEYEATLVQKQRAAEQRRAEAETQLENRSKREAWAAALQEAIQQFPKVWEHLNMEERREVLSQLLRSLTFDRAGRTATVRVHLHLLPPREIPIVVPPPRRPKKERQGVRSLTPRHLALLYWLGEGKSLEEAAAALEITSSTGRVLVSQLRKRLGVRDLGEAVHLARWRINAMLPKLPLGRLRSPTFQDPDAPTLSLELMEVLPYFAQGATIVEVARLAGINRAAVAGRRTLILESFRTKSMFEAVQKAKAAGIL